MMLIMKQKQVTNMRDKETLELSTIVTIIHQIAKPPVLTKAAQWREQLIRQM